MGRRVRKEQDLHRRAYRFYLELGPGRTLAQVAREFGVTQASVQRWAKSFDWQRRVDQHDAQVARRTLDLAEQDSVETDAKARARNLQLTQMALLQLAKALSSGNVRFQASDLTRLVELERTLVEGPDAARRDKSEGDEPALDDLSIEELWQLVENEVDAINRLIEHDNHVAALEAEGKNRPLPALARPARLGAPAPESSTRGRRKKAEPR